MKRLILLLLFVLLIGCGHREYKIPPQLCTEVYSDGAPRPWENRFAAAMNKQLAWPTTKGRVLTLTVKFLNGNDFQQECVKYYAKEWEESSALIGETGFHKIQYLFLGKTAPAPADIRIRFTEGVSQSRIGRDCLKISQDSATTTFGWVDRAYSQRIIRQVILHELGHTLGLIHEHQSPQSPIRWDSAKVYAYYLNSTHQNPPWDSSEVMRSIFHRYNKAEINGNEFDPKSIMCYSFPAEMMKDHKGIAWNWDISEKDKSFIKDFYP